MPPSVPRCFLLSSRLDDLGIPYVFADAEKDESGFLTLAKAFASSPLWKQLPRSVMVVRHRPQPALAIVGYFDDVGESRVRGLYTNLGAVLARLVYVDYPTVEKHCERLALELDERFGAELSRFCFAGIPRGGLIVLGMLAYMLDLRRDQLEPPYSPDVPLVVVDDCAFTGVRFRECLERTDVQSIVFATLFSHPALRSAIEATEPRVTACISAQDLHDHAPDRFGEEYQSWLSRWKARSGERCYWIGQPDHVCFPWSEPDITFWNPTTNEEEGGWRVVPPEYCLKNRPMEREGVSNRIQLQPSGKGPLSPAPSVLTAELEGELIVADGASEESFVLNGVAADLWRAIVTNGSREGAIRSLADSYDVDHERLRADFEPFIDDLLRRGLLKESDVCDSPGRA